MNYLNKEALKRFIRRYEEVYLFATKNISSIMAEQLDDLSLEQFTVLRHLAYKGILRSTELAEYCGVNKSAITAKIDRLEERGLVGRIRDEKDRRNIYIQLTKKGEEVYMEAQEKMEDFIGSYIEELTEKEFETFLNLYEKIINIIEKKQKEGAEK